jgi:HD-GYP domain-containing protein (c-di-GMP phosphodiesterase class II)
VKLPGLDTRGALRPAIEEFVADGRSREPDPLEERERNVEIARIVALVGACGVIAAVTKRAPDVDLGLALGLTVAYALAAVVRFEVGAGVMVPTQVVFIPMLLLLPPWIVPVAVALGTVLSDVPAVVRRRIHPDRLLLGPANAWYAVGPALVIALAGSDGPAWADVPIYALAFGAQVAGDVASTTVREWLVRRISPSLQMAVLARVYMVDALLTPVGLLAAFAGAGNGYRSLLVLPLVALIAIFAQEREQHIESALQLSTAYRGTALLLGDVLEDKDAYTASHSHGVVSLSLAVADRMGLDPAARRRVEFAALLHDIGKIAVPAEIINKPGPLDDDEWAVMKLHTVEGQHMLDRVGGLLGEVGRVVRSSHEHYDGSGYPDRLVGEEIPVEACIVAACDAFSAMTTTRSYRNAMSLESAREELMRNSGTQFDPVVVSALLDVIRDQQAALTAECFRASASDAPRASSEVSRVP